MSSKTIPELVIMPYRHADGTPESLHLAIASILKFSRIRNGLDIWVIGDKPSIDLPENVHHYSFACLPSLTPHVNIIRAIVSFLAGRKEKRFIMWHDDTMVTTDFSTVGDFREPSLHEWPERDEHSHNYFIADMARTRTLLEGIGVTPINYCCHAPHVYKTKPFLDMVQKYNLQMRSYDYETLYFNMQRENPDFIGDWRQNDYSTIIMPNDREHEILDKIAGHSFLSFGGNLTSANTYDFVGNIILGTPCQRQEH
uniref:Uncharacterized protein n=1 Tax=uncultured bacterium fosmid pJB83B9 TaxID=1478070 RepID=A0A0H3UAL7_9BACT|nr:hypothetical protein [uncultured bacterium fosmid pJB83B9]